MAKLKNGATFCLRRVPTVLNRSIRCRDNLDSSNAVLSRLLNPHPLAHCLEQRRPLSRVFPSIKSRPNALSTPCFQDYISKSLSGLITTSRSGLVSLSGVESQAGSLDPEDSGPAHHFFDTDSDADADPDLKSFSPAKKAETPGTQPIDG